MRGATIGLGAMGTMDVMPRALETTYGSRTPMGAILFLRARAVGKRGEGMEGMEGIDDMNPYAFNVRDTDLCLEGDLTNVWLFLPC